MRIIRLLTLLVLPFSACRPDEVTPTPADAPDAAMNLPDQENEEDQARDMTPPDMAEELADVPDLASPTLELRSDSLTVGLGETQRILAVLLPEARAILPEEVTWSVTPTERASLDAGLLTALRVGEVEVKGCAQERCDALTLSIIPEPGASLIVEPEWIMVPGERQLLSVSYQPSEGDARELDPQDLSFESFDEAIVGVDPRGELEARAPGNALVTVTLGPLSTRTLVKVRTYDRLELSPEPIAPFIVGKKLQLQAVALSDDDLVLAHPAPDEITWTSLTPELTEIDPSGLASFIHPGTTTLQGAWHNAVGKVTYRVELKWKDISCALSQNCCGLSIQGQVYCWGQADPLLGTHPSYSLVPVPIRNPVPLESIVASPTVGCGLDAQGHAWCWGDNIRGTVGDGTGLRRPVPVQVNTTKTFTKLDIAHGSTVCGLTAQQELYCWGSFPVGYWDAGSTPTPTSSGADPIVSYIPILITPELISDFTTNEALCVKRVSDGLWMCQGPNGQGVLGDGTIDSHETFQDMATTIPFIDIAMGNTNSCGIDLQHKVWCWGSNLGGSAGRPVTTEPPDPYYVPTRTSWDNNFDNIIGKKATYCSLETQSITCWGLNACLLGVPFDQLHYSHTPVVVRDFDYKRVSIGGSTICYINQLDDLYCWGMPPHLFLIPTGLSACLTGDQLVPSY